MYFIARSLLILAVILAAYSVAIAILLGWPTSGILVVAVALARVARRQAKRWTTLGSARWADDNDLRRAGMLDVESGAILGRIFVPPEPVKAVRAITNFRIPTYEACERFRHVFARHREHLVRLPQAIHTSVFAPSGAGKGVSYIIPHLMSCPDACVVIDFKGENARLTADYRRRVFGHRIVLIDPFHVVTETPDTWNVLDRIHAGSPTAIDECNDLAKALVVRSPDEKEPHWSDSAEAWIAAILAMVIHYGGTGETRSLQTMREVLSSSERIAMAIKVMKESEAWSGMLARMGGQLELFVEREKSSVLSTVLRHLRFLDTPTIDASTRASTFDPSDLAAGKMTIYLVLPPEHLRGSSGLLRLWISSVLREVVKRGLDSKNTIHMILDEAASFGPLESIDDAIDKYRGYSCKLHFIYQSLGQLRKCFPNGQDQTLLSNTTQIFFGVNDTATAELVSTRLGEQTVVVESGGSSSGSTTQQSTGGQSNSSRSYSENSSTSWNQQARRLLKLEEVISLDPRIAITFAPGVPPINTELIRYYEEPAWGQAASVYSRSVKAIRMLGIALVCFVVSLIVAIGMTSALGAVMTRRPY